MSESLALGTTVSPEKSSRTGRGRRRSFPAPTAKTVRHESHVPRAGRYARGDWRYYLSAMPRSRLLALGSLPVLGLAATLGLLTASYAAKDVEANRSARRRDRFIAKVATQPCARIRPSTAAIDRARKVNESFTFAVQLENLTSAACDASVQLDAASFKVSPALPEQHATVPPEGGVVNWNLMPEHDGPQEIFVTMAGSKATYAFEVRHAELVPPKLALAGSMLSALLGPMLTLPYWLERRQKRREEAAEQKAAAEKKSAEEKKTATILDAQGRPYPGT